MAEVQGFVVGFANSARCMVDMYADFVGAWVITCGAPCNWVIMVV